MAAFATSNVHAGIGGSPAKAPGPKIPSPGIIVPCSTIQDEINFLKENSLNRVGLILTSQGLPGSGYSNGKSITLVSYLNADMQIKFPSILSGGGDMLFNDREFLHEKPNPCPRWDFGCDNILDTHPFTTHGPDYVRVKLYPKTRRMRLTHNGTVRNIKLVCDGTGLMTGNDTRKLLFHGGSTIVGSGKYILSFYHWQEAEIQVPN